MRALDVDEIEAGLLRQCGGASEGGDDAGDVGIRDHVGRGAAELPVEERVRIRGDGLQPGVVVRVAVAPGVRELEAGEEVVRRAEALRVGAAHVCEEARERGRGLLRDHHLARVAAPVLHDGARLAPEEQLGAARCEAHPAAAGVVARRAVRKAVPALHRQDAPAVADHAAGTKPIGARERRIGRGQNRVVEVEAGADRPQVRAEGGGVLEGCGFGVCRHFYSLWMVMPPSMQIVWPVE